MKNIERGAEVLQDTGNVATWKRYNPDTGTFKYQPMLVIQVCGGLGPEGYEPPQSITLSGVEALIALRKAIDEAIKYEI